MHKRTFAASADNYYQKGSLCEIKNLPPCYRFMNREMFQHFQAKADLASTDC